MRLLGCHNSYALLSALTEQEEVIRAGLESLLKSSPAKLLKWNPWSTTAPLLPNTWQWLSGGSHQLTHLKSATVFYQDPMWARRRLVTKPSNKPHTSDPHNFSKLSLILILENYWHFTVQTASLKSQLETGCIAGHHRLTCVHPTLQNASKSTSSSHCHPIWS